MKLHEAILIESPSMDRIYRQRAQEAYTDLLRAFDRMGGVMGMDASRGPYIATQSVLRHPEDIGLVIFDSNLPENRNKQGGMSVNKRILALYLDFNRDIGEQLHHPSLRNVIIHEFIHLFDSERMSVMAPTSHLPNDEYYNDPSEINAYYQDAVEKFENTVSRLPRQARLNHISRYRDNFEDFKRLMFTMMSKDFTTHMSHDTRRKMTRRLYRYWDEEVRRMDL